MFNDVTFQQRITSGELAPRVAKEHHPTSPKADVPYCTRNQTIAYLDGEGSEVASAHQYLRPDGTLGASGLQDPKRMLVNGVLYVAWESLGKLGELGGR